jgi:hypothetical protein
MHKEILSDNQKKLLPLVKQFQADFYLVGGTAIALHLGHRRSFDFDLFSTKPFDNRRIRTQIKKFAPITKTLIESQGEMTLLVDETRFTYFEFRYPIPHPVKYNNTITLPELKSLAAMKAFALGFRPKWKDYLDLYYLFKQFTLAEIVQTAESIFGEEFNHKLFREQLAYHNDISYSDEAILMPGFEVSKEQVLQSLIDISLL